MRELAQELGGDVTITSAPGAGARVEASIPLTPGRAEQR
jgi:signal transduction histidine kinase